MENQKTLILSSLTSGNEKAVLSLEQNSEEIKGKLRLYNFKDKPSGVLTLGFLCNGKVVKSALTECGINLYTFNASVDFNFNKFSCALINIKSGKAEPLLLGATNGTVPNSLDYKLAEKMYILDDENLSIEKVENIVEDINYLEEEKIAINNAIACEMGGGEKCSQCKYRAAFFENCHTEEIEKQNIKAREQQQEKFYDEIKEQLEILFERYPEETFLCEVIPNSRWAKVDYEDSGEYYVIGIIYEHNNIKYICYGVPGEYETKAPKELSENAQWLPLDPNKPEDLGYWLTYQDAETGESIEVNVS